MILDLWSEDQEGPVKICMYVYVSSFNDIMMTNRNMVQYRIDKR